MTLIDWTGAGSGPRAASLALLISVAGNDLGSVDAIVDSYHSHTQLGSHELDRFDAVLRIRPLFWACYYYRMSVLSGYTPTGSEGWWPQEVVMNAAAEGVRARSRERA